MIVKSTKHLPNNKKIVTVELNADESLHAFREGMHYRLATPMDDVVHSDYIIGAQEVAWCSIEQKWVP